MRTGMETEMFWLGFATCGFVCIILLLVAALLATAKRNADEDDAAYLRSREDHPASYGIAHMKVVDPLDLPLPPRDGIRPIREARKEAD